MIIIKEYLVEWWTMILLLWFRVVYQKVLMHPNLHGKKCTDWFKKRSTSETNGLHIGCKFASSL